LAEGGNDVAKKKWRATWNERTFPEPDSANPHAIRVFIKKTFVDKEWIASSSEEKSIPKNPVPTTLTKAPSVGTLAPPKKTEPAQHKSDISLIDFSDTPSTPVVQPNTGNPFQTVPTNPVMPTANSNPFVTGMATCNNNLTVLLSITISNTSGCIQPFW
jgi:hypothetical protein